MATLVEHLVHQNTGDLKNPRTVASIHLFPHTFLCYYITRRNGLRVLEIQSALHLWQLFCSCCSQQASTRGSSVQNIPPKSKKRMLILLHFLSSQRSAGYLRFPTTLMWWEKYDSLTGAKHYFMLWFIICLTLPPWSIPWRLTQFWNFWISLSLVFANLLLFFEALLFYFKQKHTHTIKFLCDLTLFCLLKQATCVSHLGPNVLCVPRPFLIETVNPFLTNLFIFIYI